MRLVLDWDGTATVTDTMDMLVRRFGDGSVVDAWAERIATSPDHAVSLATVIAEELATVRRPLSAVVPWLLETVELRRGLHELVETRQPLVLSSNVRELIDPVLAHHGIRVELVANELAESGPRGWRVRFRSSEPCSICGQPCKRAFLPPGPIVYVGDGTSDRCAAQAAERIFARGALARYLEERGVAFEPFDDLLDVVAALAPTA
jgi:2-hydroxy-3-keto-5-methylthiopentenyl-1-phosphate phosphatase